MIDRIGYGREAIHAAQFSVHAFTAQPVANRGTRFDGLESDAFRGDLVGHAGKSVSAMQVHAGRSGKIEHNKFRWRRFSVHTLQNRLTDMVYIEINET